MTLHLVQLVPDTKALALFAHRAGLPGQDQGYVLHRALRDAFGGLAPQPFRALDALDRPLKVLGYGPADEAGLREALALAQPDLDRVFPSDAIAAKPMPAAFTSGKLLGYEVRICPIVRTARQAGEGAPKRELDAFVHATIGLPCEQDVDRESVYRHWLATRLIEGGAELIEATMVAFSLTGLVRRRHASPSGRTETREGGPQRLYAPRGRTAARRPDATFRGRLRVTDPLRFAQLLARGVGRHRAFGFGMLLLRPTAG